MRTMAVLHGLFGISPNLHGPKSSRVYQLLRSDGKSTWEILWFIAWMTPPWTDFVHPSADTMNKLTVHLFLLSSQINSGRIQCLPRFTKNIPTYSVLDVRGPPSPSGEACWMQQLKFKVGMDYLEIVLNSFKMTFERFAPFWYKCRVYLHCNINCKLHYYINFKNSSTGKFTSAKKLKIREF